MSWGTAFEGDDRGPVCSEKPRRRTLVPHVRRAPLRQKETAPGGALRPFQNPTVCAELKDGTRIPCAQSVAERLTLPTPCREVPARIFTASLTFELLGPTRVPLLPLCYELGPGRSCAAIAPFNCINNRRRSLSLFGKGPAGTLILEAAPQDPHTVRIGRWHLSTAKGPQR